MDCNGFSYCIDDTGLLIRFDEDRQMVSSAPYNGGLCTAKNIYNYRITSSQEKEYESIEITYKNLADSKNVIGDMVGLMTAAKIESFVHSEFSSDDFNADIFVSAGISNAMRAGDEIGVSYFAGTINTILILKERFTQNALIEAVMILTEAKITAMQDLGIVSYTSGQKATGTGTDAVLVVNGFGREIEFCGKHTPQGRDMARLFISTFTKSVMQANLLGKKDI